jgi:hypothetical protein
VTRGEAKSMRRSIFIDLRPPGSVLSLRLRLRCSCSVLCVEDGKCDVSNLFQGFSVRL